MNLTSIHKILLWCVQLIIIVVAFAYLMSNKPLTINSDITSLFSTNKNSEWQSIQQQIDSRMNTTQLYLVGHADINVASSIALALSKKIQTIDGITRVTVKLDEVPNQRMMIDSYTGVEQQLLTPKFKQAIETQNSASLFKIQFELLSQLGDQLVANTIDKDPTLAFAQYLNRSPLPASKLTITSDGFLTVNYQDKTYVLITIETAQGAFNIKAASEIVTKLNALTQPSQLINFIELSKTDEVFDGVSDEVTNKVIDEVNTVNKANAVSQVEQLTDVDIVRTGAIFYSEQASASAQWEMQWLGGLSIVATLLLIVLTYRRIVMAISTIMLIAISMLYGVVGLSLFFTEINIISLVFAITLIGISADYSFHSLTQLQQTNKNHKTPLSAIKTSLILSFMTTSLGYILLVVVPIALFKQIAVFTICGLLGALFTVLLVYPYLHQRFDFYEQSPRRFYGYIHQKHQQFFTAPKKLMAFLVLLIVTAFVIVLQNGFTDNAKAFYQASAQLTQSEQKVKDILGHKFDNQYLLIRANSQQQLLETEEMHLAQLNNLVAKGVIDSYQAVANWLPSIKQQERNNQLLIVANQQKLFEQFSQVIGQQALTVKPIHSYLLPETWFATPLGQTQKSLWFSDELEPSESDRATNKVENAHRYYSVIRFSGIHQLNQLSETFNESPNSIFVDKLADTANEIANFRYTLLMVFIMACVSAFVIFTIRFGVKKACLGLAIPLAAFIIALAISALIQGALTLFNLAAGLVILALALDYAVFYGEHGFTHSITQTTFMSALSSVFVFAMLGFSSTPAIASFGQTVFFGITIAFICSPIITKFHRIKKRKNLYDLQ